MFEPPSRPRLLSTSSAGPHTRRQSALVETISRKLNRRSELEIALEGKEEFVRTYSTYDRINGNLEIKFERDTVIRDLSILFEGQSNTFVEKVATASPTTGRTTGRHTFLRMYQPVYEDQLPENNLATAGTIYKIPFTFVVPERLLPCVCSHKTESEQVKHQHLLLPPSIGDPLLAGDGNTLMDDLAPEMAKVTYAIKARVKKVSPSSGRVLDEEEKIVKIRVVPVRDEEPPISVDEHNTSYIMRKEKNVRKGVFKIGKKLGRLTAEVTQPRSLRIPHFAKKSGSSVTTMATIVLRFDPATPQEQPPQLANLATRLRVYTFFGAASYKFLPELSKCDNWSSLHGMYPDTVELASRNIGSVTWLKHDPDSLRRTNDGTDSDVSRRPSAMSIDSAVSRSSSEDIPYASAVYDSKLPFYTSKVLVPIMLPNESNGRSSSTRNSVSSLSGTSNSKKIIFLSTFHTCIVSRTYALELALSFVPVNAQGNSGTTLVTSSMTLRTPIQVTQEGSSPTFTETALIPNLAPYSTTETQAIHEHDEAVAQQLDRELNFTNPFRRSEGALPMETTPEYEEVQTSLPSTSSGGPRYQSITTVPSQAQPEQPPDYFSTFAETDGGRGDRGRRNTVVTGYPIRSLLAPMAFMNAL